MEKSLLEQIEIGARIFSWIAIPIVLLTLGSCINNSYKEGKTREKYIDFAITILNNRPTPDTLPVREWAVRILNLYAEKKMPASVREALKTTQLNQPCPIVTSVQKEERKEEEKK